jgi:hypothetical protein
MSSSEDENLDEQSDVEAPPPEVGYDSEVEQELEVEQQPLAEEEGVNKCCL